jgi:methionyl-tRNA formyltransferase
VTARARTVFLGSGAFAVPIVDALAAHPATDLVAIVTAPPRPAGRGATLHPTPVGAWAAGRGLGTLTPQRLLDPAVLDAIRALSPDLLVLADYGRLVPSTLLDLPRFGALNLHPSLLPRHRGATPIPATILTGDPETGVTLMRMDEGLDTGPIVAQRTVAVRGEETAPELEARLSSVAADLLMGSLAPWLSGELEARPQDPAAATLTRPLRREDGVLDPRLPAADLERQVRAYQPWPGSYLDTEAGRIIVWRAGVRDAAEDEGMPLPADSVTPGRLVATVAAEPAGDPLAMTTGRGLLRLLEVQPAGRRRMSGAALLRGRPHLVGTRVALPA